MTRKKYYFFPFYNVKGDDFNKISVFIICLIETVFENILHSDFNFKDKFNTI